MKVEAPVYGYGFYSRRKRFNLFSRARLRRWFAFLGVHNWFGILLTFVTLGIAVYSVEQARWVTPQAPLIVVLLLSLVATAVVLRFRLHRAVMIGALVAAGVIVTGWQAARLSGHEPVLKALLSAPNQGTIHFAVFIVMVTWAAGVVSLWFLIRRGNAWVAAAIGALIVIVNLSNLPPSHLAFFPLYLAAALILVGYTTLARQPGWPHENGVGHRRRGAFYPAVSLIVVAAIAVSSAWFIPDMGVSRVGVSANGQIVTQIENNWLNIFAGVPGKWSVIKNDSLQTLAFSSPLDNRDTVLFVVTSPQAAYWRIQAYSYYQSSGWSNPATDSGQVIKAGTPSDPGATTARQPLTYTVENEAKTDVLLVPGEFVSSSVPVNVESPAIPGVSAAGVGGSIAVVTPYLLQPYQQYTAVSSVSTATPSNLEQAGTSYPSWVTLADLQLPSSLPYRVRQLAAATTRGAATPYAKALAIQQYVQGLTYNKNAKSPSLLGDEVDSFLFVQKQGVCTDFATAMVVMLRSVGVPARLATGYLPGVHQDGTDTYSVRGKDYHAWAEVYFPGYGWIDFEATPPAGVSPAVTPAVTSGTTAQPSFPQEFPIPYGSGQTFVTGSAPAKPKPNRALPIALGILAVLSVAIVLWVVVRRMYNSLRLSGDAEGVYAKMCRLGSMIGLSPVFSETPLEYCRRLAGAFPDGSDAIISIGSLYAQARFSPRKELPQFELVRLQKSWVQVYPLLFKRRLPWNRRAQSPE